MSANTSIEWTDATWNPVRGCSRVSPGCEHCYAEGIAARFAGPGLPYAGLARRASNGVPRWTGRMQLIPDVLTEPLHWRKPRRVFVNSMSDLFHESLSDEDIAAVFGVMAAAPQHTFQILTKRAKRMRAWFAGVVDHVKNGAFRATWKRYALPGMPRPWGDRAWPLPNVWLGVSVEDQQRADERIPHLLETPAAVRFVSAEPLLESVNLCAVPDSKTRPAMYHPRYSALGDLDWIIVGGESGPGARPFDLAWARRLVVDCEAAGVACFVKQLGRDPIDGLAGCTVVLRNRKGADMTEWPAELRVREFPEVPCSP